MFGTQATTLFLIPDLFTFQEVEDASEGKSDSKKYITIKFSAEQVSHHPPGDFLCFLLIFPFTVNSLFNRLIAV